MHSIKYLIEVSAFADLFQFSNRLGRCKRINECRNEIAHSFFYCTQRPSRLLSISTRCLWFTAKLSHINRVLFRPIETKCEMKRKFTTETKLFEPRFQMQSTVPMHRAVEITFDELTFVDFVSTNWHQLISVYNHFFLFLYNMIASFFFLFFQSNGWIYEAKHLWQRKRNPIWLCTAPVSWFR